MLKRALALPLLLLTACGGEPEQPTIRLARDLKQPIKGGQFDFERTHAVGMITQLGQFQGSCSGTLIAPNLVLTARHCVSQNLTSGGVICGQAGFGNPYPGDSIFITPDIQMSQQSPFFQGQSVVVPSEGSDTCGFDIALVILAENVPESLAVPAIPRVDLEAQQSETYDAVGYGSEGFTFGGGRKALNGLTVMCTAGSCSFGNQIATTEWLGDTGVCQGDSGGPAFDADDKVIGVVSRGGMGCTSPIYGDVASWRQLIMSTAIDAASQGGYEPPFWATTGSSEPPPGTGGVGGMGGMGGDSGSAGAAGADPQGQPCSGACPAGYSCITPSGNADDAICSAQCSSSDQCSDGFECAADLGACFPESNTNAADSGDSGGCSFAPPLDPAKPVPWALALGALGLAALRRRR